MYTLENALDLSILIHHVLVAHAKHPRKPENAFRRWDGKTPYGVHPIEAAMTFLLEPGIPPEFREDGWQALLCHDLPEDTHTPLPEGISPRVAELVKEMTFASPEDKRKHIWARSKWVRLLSLYDEVSNWQDSVWKRPERREIRVAHLSALCDDVLENFGRLHIVQMARALIAEPCVLEPQAAAS